MTRYDELSQISLVRSAVYQDEAGEKSEPVEIEVHEATAEDLTPASVSTYNLPIDDSMELLLGLDSLQANYENLDFDCEVS